jgi:thymidylate synthase
MVVIFGMEMRFSNYLKNRDRFSNKDNVKEDVVINGMNGSSNRAYNGKQWRCWHSNAKVTMDGKYYEEKGIDQIANLINDLKTNPDSRRLMVNAWNVGELDQMASSTLSLWISGLYKRVEF